MIPACNNIATILLIDDDEDDYHFFREAVTAVSPCTSIIWLPYSCDLLKSMEVIQPSLIFMDFNMPGMNGPDCVRQLKAHPEFNLVPVVMWSTSSIVRNVKEAYDAGIELFLEKPWCIKVLAAELKNIFSP
jgi:CheY-like chemotaxis protein